MGRPSLIEAISATAARRVFARLPGLNRPQAQASTDGGLVLGCESQYPFRSLTAAGELCPIPLAVPIPRTWILASDGDALWLVDQSNRFLKLTISTCETRQMLHATPLLNRGQANGFTPGAPLEIFCNGFTIGTLPVAQAIGTILAVSHKTPALAYVVTPADGSCLDLRLDPSPDAPFVVLPAIVQQCPNPSPDISPAKCC